MQKLFENLLPIFSCVFFLFNDQIAAAKNFNDSLRDVRAEINIDNLQDAMTLFTFSRPFVAI